MYKKGKRISTLSSWCKSACWILVAGGLVLGKVHAQIAFSRFHGDPSPLSDSYRIELFNSMPTTLEVSAHLIVTRYCIAQIPANTYLRPLQRLVMANSSLEGEENVLSFEDISLFLERKVPGDDEGDFLLLLSPDFNILDAFYFSQDQNVDFLPFQEPLALEGGEATILRVPGEEDARWKHLRTLNGQADPALAFVQVNGVWKINSRSKNMLPATQFVATEAHFKENRVQIEWRVQDEQECYNYLVERSEDGIFFQQLGIVPARGNAADHTYTFQDVNIQSDNLYYYRVRNQDKFGYTLFSDIAPVQTGVTSDRFEMSVLNVGNSVNIRFLSSNSQRIRIKLMDEAFREMDLLFVGEVEGGKDNLIEYSQKLSLGKYYFIALTERQRVYEALIIE